MTVRSERAEVTLDVFTDWYMPETPDSARRGIRPGAVCIHTAFPRYEGQSAYGGPCELWSPCYTDAGYLIADEPTGLLVTDGSDAVWEWLEAFHADILVGEVVATSR